MPTVDNNKSKEMNKKTIQITIEVETDWDEMLIERNAERLADDFATEIASMDATDYPVIDVSVYGE